MLIRLLVCAGVGAARLLEVAYSRRNLRRSGEANEGPASRRTFPLILLVHTVVICGTALRGGRARLPWLALFFSVQPLRFWAIKTLGERWNVRGSVAQEMEVARDGPYAYVRHPNYTVIFVELLSLPMAFGLKRLALGATLVNAVLLTFRIRDEERLLAEVPGYVDHFGNKPRFVPAPRLTRRRGGSEGPSAGG